MSVVSPIMRYHGGKFRLAAWVMQFFPAHQCYVEPFGGAGSVLMQKQRCYAEVYNDLDGEVVNVFRVLRDEALREKLIEQCILTPFSRDEFRLSYQPSSDPVEQACRTLFRAQAGFGSAGSSGLKTGFRCDSKRAYSLAAHIWAKYPEHIRSFGERLEGVIIENRPAIDVIQANDDLDTLHYVDPPYTHDARKMSHSLVYRHEMTDDDHRQLLQVLHQVQGYVVLSGYRSELYDDLLADWTRHETKARISAGRGTGLRTECVWLNDRAEKYQVQKGLALS